MVKEYGMSERIGFQTIPSKDVSPNLNNLVEIEIKQLLEVSLDNTILQEAIENILLRT